MKYFTAITMMRYQNTALGVQQMTSYRSRVVDLRPEDATRGNVLKYMHDVLGPGFEQDGDAVLMFFDVQPDQLPADNERDEGEEEATETQLPGVKDVLLAIREEITQTLGIGGLLGHPVLEILDQRIADYA